MGERAQHGACVDAWLEKRAANLSSAALLTLFDSANQALWVRSKTTLGEVTLTAIADRVRSVATERHPFLAGLTIDQVDGIRAGALAAQAEAMPPDELVLPLRFVLVELLTVLGNLTAEILTPGLHAALERVTLPPTTRPEKGRKRRP